jgi:DNA (cytosine-5)-methyltransferase 1
MRFGSVCSGIEAASVAWHPLGWRAAWLAEIEPFPSAVLRHHYSEVPNLGDMTTLPERILRGEVEAPDLFCGGTPCQAFSVAGLRRSLDDARGNLSLTFCEIADAIDSVRLAAGKPASIIFWENVPGVLSTQDNAFGCFLAGLAGEDEPLVAPGGKWTDAGVVFGPARAVAWRTLDAQYFGLAQRRKRVFVVASARDGFDPAAVLFEFDGVRRDSAPRREAGEGAAPCVTAGAANGGAAHGARSGSAKDNLIVPVGIDFQNASLSGDIAGTLDAEGQKRGNRGHGVLDVSMCLNAGGQRRLDAESETLIPTIGGGFDGPVGITLHGTDGTANVASLTDLSSSLRARIPSGVENSTTTAVMQPVEQPFTLAIRGRGDSHNLEHRQDGTANALLTPNGGRGGIGVGAIAFHPTQDPISSTDICHAIGTGNGRGCATAAVAFDTYNQSVNSHTSQTIKSPQGAVQESVGTVLQAMQVRRLTPTECERLQGFPDGYTQIPWRKKPASECPDGPRYKALGNSWAVPVVRWIGRRINERIGNE